MIRRSVRRLWPILIVLFLCFAVWSTRNSYLYSFANIYARYLIVQKGTSVKDLDAIMSPFPELHTIAIYRDEILRTGKDPNSFDGVTGKRIYYRETGGDMDSAGFHIANGVVCEKWFVRD